MSPSRSLHMRHNSDVYMIHHMQVRMTDSSDARAAVLPSSSLCMRHKSNTDMYITYQMQVRMTDNLITEVLYCPAAAYEGQIKHRYSSNLIHAGGND